MEQEKLKTNLKRLPKKELKLHFYLMSNQRCALKQELSAEIPR